MKLLIENSYSDGHKSEQEVEIIKEPTVFELADGYEAGWGEGIDDTNWWWGIAYQHTGDGHGSDVPGLHSYYKATIIEAGNPNIVGRYYEWSD